MVTTPTSWIKSEEEGRYRGLAMSQMRILQQQLALGQLNSGSRVVRLDNGVVIECNVCFNRQDIHVTLPAAMRRDHNVQPETVPWQGIPFLFYEDGKLVRYVLSYASKAFEPLGVGVAAGARAFTMVSDFPTVMAPDGFGGQYPVLDGTASDYISVDGGLYLADMSKVVIGSSAVSTPHCLATNRTIKEPLGYEFVVDSQPVSTAFGGSMSFWSVSWRLADGTYTSDVIPYPLIRVHAVATLPNDDIIIVATKGGARPYAIAGLANLSDYPGMRSLFFIRRRFSDNSWAVMSGGALSFMEFDYDNYHDNSDSGEGGGIFPAHWSPQVTGGSYVGGSLGDPRITISDNGAKFGIIWLGGGAGTVNNVSAWSFDTRMTLDEGVSSYKDFVLYCQFYYTNGDYYPWWTVGGQYQLYQVTADVGADSCTVDEASRAPVSQCFLSSVVDGTDYTNAYGTIKHLWREYPMGFVATPDDVSKLYWREYMYAKSPGYTQLEGEQISQGYYHGFCISISTIPTSAGTANGLLGQRADYPNIPLTADAIVTYCAEHGPGFNTSDTDRTWSRIRYQLFPHGFDADLSPVMAIQGSLLNFNGGTDHALQVFGNTVWAFSLPGYSNGLVKPYYLAETEPTSQVRNPWTNVVAPPMLDYKVYGSRCGLGGVGVDFNERYASTPSSWITEPGQTQLKVLLTLDDSRELLLTGAGIPSDQWPVGTGSALRLYASEPVDMRKVGGVEGGTVSGVLGDRPEINTSLTEFMWVPSNGSLTRY